MKKVLAWIFTVVYFSIFHIFIYLIITNFFAGTIAEESLLTIFCWVIAFLISVGLGDFTEKKISEFYSKKQ